VSGTAGGRWRSGRIGTTPRPGLDNLEPSLLLGLEESLVLVGMSADQPANSGPAGLAGPALPVRVEFGEAGPLAALAPAIHRPHPTELVGVLAATPIGELGGAPLAVLAVAGQAATARIEVLGPLHLCAGRTALKSKPRRVR
jgi:hypothetical protein